jgi:unsaturated chondroitin disaccharide hydrolase
MSDLISRDERRQALDAILHFVEYTLPRLEDRFPLVGDTETGEWETTADGNWCGGHWVGLLWLASERSTSDGPEYESAAKSLAELVDDAIPRDTMFYGLNAEHAGFRGYDATGDRELFAFGLRGADAMADLFHLMARQVQSGDYDIAGPDGFREEDTSHHDSGCPESTGLCAVDNVFTALPVLWRAYRETGKEHFRDLAVAHADRHIDWFVRSNGSTWHHATFDARTGALRDRDNAMGNSDDSCWARGFGWHVAGLARAYRETGAERYLSVLEQSLDYYRSNTPDDGIPHWDFEVEATPETPRDTSAAALVAYGLCQLPDIEATASLRTVGASVLSSLVSHYLLTDAGESRRGLVTDGCYNMPSNYATDNALIWTQYYVGAALDALDRRNN